MKAAPIVAVAAAVFLQGCIATGAQKVAVDVRPVDKPMPVPCRTEWPDRPTPYVSQVQLTGDPQRDLPPLWRAAEAELEERIAYEKKLEAAARKCVDGAP